MLNFNGEIIKKSEFRLKYDNRGFTYGDSIFDTLKYQNNSIEFIEQHYFRLLASMRMLRMEIPLSFTLDFYKNELKKTVAVNQLEKARVKCTIYRKSGGYYTPTNNSILFLMEVSDLNYQSKEIYKIDIFKDYYVNADLLSTIKTTNRMLNVLSSIFTNENKIDNCILLNHNKHIVEANNANLFLIFQNRIITPPLKDGCINGIMRKKVIESIQQIGDFVFEEKSVSSFDMQKADSVFLTNSIIGIQTVTHFKRKEYNTYLVEMVKKNFNPN